MGKCRGTSQYPDAGRHPTEVGPPGRIIDGHIVGGKEARVNEFPYQVYLRAGNSLCGAVILDTKWVITAAHCVNGLDASDIIMELGAHDRRNDIPESVKMPASLNVVHPYYQSSSSGYDVAMLKMASEITFDDTMRAACKPSNSDPSYYVNKNATISGWGTIYSGGPTSSTLLYTQVYVASLERCQQDYPYATETMVCAGLENGSGRDTCQGDSGGPITYKNSNGQFELLGLTSFGRGCASGYLGVYARVHSFLDWIDEVRNSN